MQVYSASLMKRTIKRSSLRGWDQRSAGPSETTAVEADYWHLHRKVVFRIHFGSIFIVDLCARPRPKPCTEDPPDRYDMMRRKWILSVASDVLIKICAFRWVCINNKTSIRSYLDGSCAEWVLAIIIRLELRDILLIVPANNYCGSEFTSKLISATTFGPKQSHSLLPLRITSVSK